MNNEDLINKIVHLMQTDNSADAPADAVKWSKNLFRARVAEPKRSLAQRILAVLQMELAPDKAVFGERSASATQARQMLFGAGDHQIDLRIAKAAKGFALAGQILGAGSAEAKVKLSGGNKEFTVSANELSEFKFENVAKGVYSLALTLKDQEIVIENIEIG